MRNKLKTIITGGLLAASLLAVTPFITPVYDVFADGVSQAKDGINKVSNGDNHTVEGILKSITSMLLFIIGAISVIVIVYSGLKYVTSNGNPESIRSAKHTLIYAIVGLIIAISAYAIVNFVLQI